MGVNRLVVLLLLVSLLVLSLAGLHSLVVQHFISVAGRLLHPCLLVHVWMERWLGLLHQASFVVLLPVIVLDALAVEAEVLELQMDHFDLLVGKRELPAVDKVLKDVELVQDIGV